MCTLWSAVSVIFWRAAILKRMRKGRGKRLLALSCPSVRISVGPNWKEFLVVSSEMCLEAPHLFQVGHKYQTLHMKTSVNIVFLTTVADNV